LKELTDLKILVADDDLITSLALSRNLQDWGYEVAVARNGAEALSILKSGETRIAILDWMMPHLTGVQVTQKVRQDFLERGMKYTYIILLSGSDGYEEIVKGLSSGADAYIAKPYSFGELRIRLQHAERTIRMEDERGTLASFDEQTGLWSRARMREFLEEEKLRAGREKNPVGLVLMALDSLAEIEAAYGPSVAVQVLAETARRLKKAIRRYDKVGRFGLREFLIILPGCGQASTERIAERLVRFMSKDPVISDAGLILLSLSSGYASTERNEDISSQTLFEACQAALATALRRKSLGASPISPPTSNPR